MICLGLSFDDCKQYSAMKKISFIPSTVFTNQNLEFIISDLLNGESDDFINENADGSFIPCVYFYTCAVWWVTDLMHLR